MELERRSPHQIHISRIYFRAADRVAPERPGSAPAFRRDLLRMEAVHAQEWKRN